MNSLLMTGFLVGAGVGIGLTSILFFVIFKFDLVPLVKKAQQLAPALLVALLGFVTLFGAQVHGALASTPVPLTIPTDVIFTSANDWIATFAPIAAIGIGIAIALAVLGYLGKMIVGAFKA